MVRNLASLSGGNGLARPKPLISQPSTNHPNPETRNPKLQAGSGEYTIDAGVKYAGEVASTGANLFSSLFRKLSSMVGSEEEGSSEAKKDL
jgi:hypothetical protein